jgi:NAD(P)H-flavin reductase
MLDGKRLGDGRGMAFRGPPRARWHDMVFGARVHLDGPYGVAYLGEDSPRDILCLAGGSGFGPVVSITRAAAASESLKERFVHSVYGGRSARDICGEHALRLLRHSRRQTPRDFVP